MRRGFLVCGILAGVLFVCGCARYRTWRAGYAERVKRNEAELARREQERYEEAMEKYERDLARYERDLAAYEASQRLDEQWKDGYGFGKGKANGADRGVRQTGLFEENRPTRPLKPIKPGQRLGEDWPTFDDVRDKIDEAVDQMRGG